MFTLARKIFPYLRRYRVQFFWALGQVFLLSALELLKPWPLKIVIDNVLGENSLPWFSNSSPKSLLLYACLGIVLIYLLLAVLTFVNNYTTISIGQRMVNDLRKDLFSHLQRLSLAFHSRRQVGDLLYRVATDTYAIQTITMNGLLPVLSALVLLGGMFAVMVQIDTLLTLLALIVCPVLFVSISLLNNRISSAATHARQQESEVYSLVQRSMSDIRIIQAFTKEEDEHNRFMVASEKSLNANLRFYTLQTFYSGMVNVVIALGTAVVIWVAADHVLSGVLSVGEMIIFTSYLASLYMPINNISQTWGLVQGAKVGAWRVFELLEEKQDLMEGSKVFPPSGAKGDITWSGVSFHYAENQPILDQIELSVKAGQKVAIVGSTGAGKSTLLSLLPRFYDPQAGRVTIDGIDIRDFQLKSLRRQIAMVLQPPLVFPLTIRENIAYGDAEATLEEIIYAAKLARIHDFIIQLPLGYDTVVGEQGGKLSEGQKQRITIARAILRNAPILILDEPTSSLDVETESLIMEGIEELIAGKTTFIIAHRLATVRQADQIIVLDSGRIIEKGTFAELMSQKGAFASLYRSQFSNQGKKRVSPYQQVS
jgi:ATP-binding cassette subfamily B protein